MKDNKDVLNELNIDLAKQDSVNKDKDYVVQQDDFIQITRVETKTISEVEPLKYSTVTTGSGSWTRTVEQEGQNGEIKKTYLVTYANGHGTGRKIIKEESERTHN